MIKVIARLAKVSVAMLLVAAISLLMTGDPARSADPGSPGLTGGTTLHRDAATFPDRLLMALTLGFDHHGRDGMKLRERVLSKVWNTALLAIPAFFTVLVFSVWLSVIQASESGRVTTWLARLSPPIASVPPFVIGIGAIMVFSLWLPAVSMKLLGFKAGLPMGGTGSVFLGESAGFVSRARDLVRHMALPVGTFSLGAFALLFAHHCELIGRAMTSGFVLAARARGLTRQEAAWRHALPYSMPGILKASAAIMPQIVNMAIVVEIVFSWPGIGRMTYEALLSRDQTLMVAGLMGSAYLCVALDLLATGIEAVITSKCGRLS